MIRPSLNHASPLPPIPASAPGREQVQPLLKKILEALDFKVFDLPHQGHGGPRLFARRGTGLPHLCFTIRSVKWLSLSAIVGALSAHAAQDSPFSGSVSFLVADDGMHEAMAWMAANAHTPDLCIAGGHEDSVTGEDEVRIGRRGLLTGALAVHGIAGGMDNPERAENPLPRLIDMLSSLNTHIFDKGSAWFSPSHVEVTGIGTLDPEADRIPARATALFAVRFSDRWTGQRLEDQIRHVLNGISNDYTLDVAVKAESYLTKPGEWTNLIAGALESARGKKPRLTTDGGLSESLPISRYCPVVECGLAGGADLSSLTAMNAAILERFFPR